MDAQDAGLVSEVKLEVDVAEEPVEWLMHRMSSSERRGSSATGEQDTPSYIPSSAVHTDIKSEPATDQNSKTDVECEDVKVEVLEQHADRVSGENITCQPLTTETQHTTAPPSTDTEVSQEWRDIRVKRETENVECETVMVKPEVESYEDTVSSKNISCQPLTTETQYTTAPPSTDTEVSQEWRDIKVKCEPMACTYHTHTILQQENPPETDSNTMKCPSIKAESAPSEDEQEGLLYGHQPTSDQRTVTQITVKFSFSTPTGSLRAGKAAVNMTDVSLQQTSPHICSVCSKSFALAGDLHKKSHTGDGQYVCDGCCRACPPASSPERHTPHGKIDTGLTGHKPYVCDVCGKAFSLASNLKRHKMIHTGDKPYVCDVCSKAFRRSIRLRTHKMIHTGEKPYVCDVCSKAFCQKSDLKKHIMIHTCDKSYMCDVCSKTFSKASKLKKHKKIHSGDKPYVCDVCSKAFSWKGTLKKHNMIHTGEKPYVCDVCSKTFSQSFMLKTHKMIHAGDKPYVCDVCSKAFRQKGALKKHNLIHTGDKPYVCDICTKAFRHSSTLKGHKKIHTRDTDDKQ